MPLLVVEEAEAGDQDAGWRRWSLARQQQPDGGGRSRSRSEVGDARRWRDAVHCGGVPWAAVMFSPCREARTTPMCSMATTDAGLEEPSAGGETRDGSEVRARLQDPGAGQQCLGASGQPWRPAGHTERGLRVQEKERREGGTEGEGSGSAWSYSVEPSSGRAYGRGGAPLLWIEQGGGGSLRIWRGSRDTRRS